MRRKQSQSAGLSPKIRKEIERRLSKRGFNSYERLARWLREQGVRVSVLALRNFKSRLSAVPTKSHRGRRRKLSRTWNGTAEGLISLARDKLGSALAEVGQFQQGDMSRLAHAVAHLIQAGVALQRWQTQLNRQAGRKEMGRSSALGMSHGLTNETSQVLREALLGIAPNSQSDQEGNHEIESFPEPPPERPSEKVGDKK